MHLFETWRVCIFAAVLAAGSAAASPPSGVSVGQSTDKLGTIDLPSGMRIVIEEDHSKPVVAVVAVINAGGADDPAGKEGLAHLVEHLTFRAKPDGKIQRANQLDFAGAASWNGSTTHDLTTYMVAGPKESLRNLLVIEGARLMGPLAGLDERAFEIERDVVKNEVTTDRDEQGEPGARARLYEALYPDAHRYHRSVIGTPESVSALTLADAQAFVQEHYVPSNVTLYVAGDLDLATIHQLFGQTLPEHFAVAPPSGAVPVPVRLAKEAPPLPAVPASKTVETLKAPVAAPTVYVGWSLPRGYGADGSMERAVRLALEAVPVWVTANSDIQSIRATLVAGRDNSTLLCAVTLKEGRRPEKSLERVLDQFHRFSEPSATSGYQSGEEVAGRLDSTLSSGNAGGGRTLAAAPSLTVIGGSTAASQMNNGGQSSLSTNSRGPPDAVTPADVQVARFQMTAVANEAEETESVLARAVDRATLAHYTGDSSAWEKDMTAITEIGPSKWQNFTLKWLSRDRARAVFVVPSGVSSEAVDTGGPPVVFAADDVRVKVASGALKNYAHGPVGDIQLLTLKNGLQVLLVRRLGAPSIAATVGVKGGSATAEPLGAAPLAVRLARPQDIGNGPPSQFGGGVTFTTGPDATYVEGRAASGNLENLLAVLSDIVQSLHVDDGFGWGWNELVDDKRRSQATPNIEAERKFLADVYPGSAMGRTAVADNIEKIRPSGVQRWIDGSFRPHNAVLAVVGDFDVKEGEKQVRDWFEKWKGAQDPKAEAPRGKLRERTGPVRILAIERPGALETEIRVGCSVEPQSQTDVIAMKMLGARLRAKLGTLARSTLGGSEGFFGGAAVQRQAARLDVAGTVDGRSLVAVLGTARKELAALEDLKPTEDELALLKWRQGIAWNGSYTTNAELAKGLVWTRLADLPVDLIQKYPDLLAAVTVQDLTRVAAACRNTAVLMVSGDPAVVDKALLATESSMMLRHGS
jgi:zinc protease